MTTRLTDLEDDFMGIAAPISAASTTGETGVLSLTGSTTGQSFPMPAGVRERYVRIMTNDADCRVNFSLAPVALTYSAQAITGSNGVLTSSAARGITLVAGTAEQFYIPGVEDGGTLYCNYVHKTVLNTTGTLEVSNATARSTRI